MKPAISVVLPVRERIGRLRRMVDSLMATASDLDDVELVMRCDVDDAPMIAYLCTCGQPFIVGPRYEGYATLGRMANEAARLAHADLVLVVNDDVIFETPGWDERLVSLASQYDDGIFVLGVETLNAGNFVFPCVSRRQIDLLGGVFDERVIYPDIWLRDVLQPFGRAIRTTDVVIRHEWAGESPDQQRASAIARTSAHDVLYARCVSEGRTKVQAALAVFQ